MKQITFLLSLFTCLSVANATNNAFMKTAFEQNNISYEDARVTMPDFAECVPVSVNLLKCPKRIALLRAQQRGREQLFPASFPIPSLDDKYLYVNVSGKCYRIIREVASDGDGFYGTQICA